MASYIYSEPRPEHAGVSGKPCKCCRLESGLDLPHPKELEVETIQQLAKSFSNDIFADWRKLNGILKCYEPIIQKRWLKKTTKQREKVLLAAEPAIPRVHRPDFEGFRNLGNRRIARDLMCGAEAHLTPYINLEDLSTGNNLLLFINSRGRNLPGIFASTEAEKAHLGLGWEERPQSEGYAMLFYGKGTPEDYGSVAKKSTLRSKVAAIQSFDATYGLLILEIQQRVYRFVLRCVQRVLHDINTDKHASVPEEPEPPALPRWLAPGDSENVTLHTIEADYRKPQEEDLSRLKMIVGGRRLAAEDHIWSLREDPGYLLDSLKECKEYHLRVPNPTPADGWRNVATHMVWNALDSLYTWNWLAEHLELMCPLHEQIAFADSTSLRLRSKDETDLVLLSQVVDESIKKSATNLFVTIPKSSGLRGRLQTPHDPATCELKSRCPSPHGCDSEWNNKFCMTPTELRVARNFYSLTGDDPHALHLHKLRPLVQETHRMLEHDKAARDLIDECLLTDFFDLAVLADIQHCIATFHPYSRSWQAANVEDHKRVRSGMEKFTYGAYVLTSVNSHDKDDLPSLGNPLDGRFHYPAEKRRTAETVKQMQSAEADLKQFWDEIALLMRRFGVDLPRMLEWHLKTDPSKVHTTEDWKEKSTARSPATPRSSSEDVEAYERFLTTPVSKENKKTELAISAKPKPKTRGKPHSETHAVQPPNPPQQHQEHHQLHPLPHQTPPPISLPRRAHKVLTALLPVPSTISHSPREISWPDLLHAFEALGLIPEKLYGSVWIFKPLPKGHEGLRVDVNRSIQFHEPKEVRHGGKIDAKMVRRFGGRLKRVFGWEGGMFGG